jgi:uroporphyrinogen decarboxylase
MNQSKPQNPLLTTTRLDDLFAGRQPDRVPMGSMSVSFGAVCAGYTVSDTLEEPDKCFEASLWTSSMMGWEPMPHYPSHSVWGAVDFGGDVRMPKGPYESSLIITRHPVETTKHVELLEQPDPRNAGRIPYAWRFASLQRQAGLPVFFSSRSPFTMAANIAGLENFMRWIVKAPELAQRLLELSLSHILGVLDYWIESFGAENIFVWMSNPNESNQVISPKHMAQWALPFHEKYFAGLAQRGLKRMGLHLCGDQNLNLPIFKEASLWPHPAILSFGHEVSIADAASYFPQDIIFGNLEPNLLQVSRPARIYEMCREIIAQGRKAPGGFMLAPGCGIPASAPVANVYAMTKAAHDFGRYA